MSRADWVERLPEPASFWIRYSPRRWPAPAGPWVDLGRARLGRLHGAPPRGLGRILSHPDVVYLPPVSGAGLGRARGLADRVLETGCPVLLQRQVGEPSWLGAAPPGHAVELFDPFTRLLEGDTGWCRELEAGSVVCWPLVGGLTDDASLWERCGEELARAGVEVVQPVRLELAPTERRALLEAPCAGAHSFKALFHSYPPSERGLARALGRHGLRPQLERPAGAFVGAAARRREVAGVLTTIGELELRLGRSDARAQLFFQAARGVDDCRFDLEGLSRDGHLGLLPWLEPPARAVLQEWVQAGRCHLLDQLWSSYLSSPETPEVG